MLVAAHEFKVGHYVCLDNKTYKIVSITISKTGKHGHMKVCITGIHVFTGQKKIHACPGHIMLQKVEPVSHEYQLLFWDPISNSIQLLDEKNELVDTYLNGEPEDIREQMRLAVTKVDVDTVTVTVIVVPEGQQIVRVRSSQKERE